ncbi:SAM-dependent methyltransferase [Flavobacterium album]|uniref:SAM-dependent methyltransferase n=1 Tax=Flavobacterium album TaxID=2175091 RepID=A0A2S1R293_9FLAO|nr:class I SAM-dependent methyltransferase [Flavobacterium album]AWH86790.1 SAM-dependent methyltransferase [Flavobacterium album]
MKDNFSTQAQTYAKFRPDYSHEIIDYIISLVPQKGLALDVATGNGQVAAKLAKHFTTVYATDISDKQLENAATADNIIYKKERAEHTSFNDKMFDLITVAQAIHWFDFDAFYKEVYRILKPDGLFIVMGYGLFSTNPESDRIIRHFHQKTLGDYWDPERRYVDKDYETIPFPFDEIEAKQFSETFTWTFEHLIGYIDSWSAVQHYIKKNGSNPVDLIRDELKESWDKSDGKAVFLLLLRVGRLKK